MRTFAIIAILFLVGTVVCTTDEEVYATIRKMEQSKYGKTLVDTI
jgi:hypothetical protein